MDLEYFQMIDEVVAVNTAEASIVVRSRVPGESTIFAGHFPDYPLMPGVLLVETMAQASGYLIMALNNFSQMPLLACVKQAKLRAPVKPRSELIVSAAMEHDGSGFAVVQAEIRQDGSLACDAMLTMKMIPFPTRKLRRHILARAESTGLLAMES